MDSKSAWLIQSNTAGVIKKIVEHENKTIGAAMDDFYSSALCEGLADVQTGLYLESPSALYALYLHPELGQ